MNTYLSNQIEYVDRVEQLFDGEAWQEDVDLIGKDAYEDIDEADLELFSIGEEEADMMIEREYSDEFAGYAESMDTDNNVDLIGKDAYDESDNWVVTEWETLSGSPGDRSGAISLNRQYGNQLGWKQVEQKINRLLLPYATNYQIIFSEDTFAESLRKWQLDNGFSGSMADGILGPKTWEIMRIHIGGSQDPVVSPANNPPQPVSILEFNKWYAEQILLGIQQGFIGVNSRYDPRPQLQAIAEGRKVILLDPKAKVVKILPIIHQIGVFAAQNKVSDILLGSFIRGANSDGVCSGHCAGISIDMNYTGGSFSNSGATRMVIEILKALESLEARYKKGLGFGLPFQGDFFVNKSLPKFKGTSTAHIGNVELRGLVQNLIQHEGAVFPDNDNHLHIQTKWL